MGRAVRRGEEETGGVGEDEICTESREQVPGEWATDVEERGSAYGGVEPAVATVEDVNSDSRGGKEHDVPVSEVDKLFADRLVRPFIESNHSKGVVAVAESQVRRVVGSGDEERREGVEVGFGRTGENEAAVFPRAGDEGL